MQLLESGEMYLETILVLSRKNPFVRSVDISAEMGFSKPSVSRAVGLLKDGGYIETDPSGHITLTAKGRKKAEQVYERHRVLSDMFRKLGVSPDTAEEDACLADVYKVWEGFVSAGHPAAALLANGINHPTPAGHQVMAEVLMKFF